MTTDRSEEIDALRARVSALEGEASELRVREAQTRQLLEFSSDLVRRFTPEAMCIYASPSCRAILGYEPEELIGRSGHELVHPDDQAFTRSSHIALPATERPLLLTYRVRAKDGSYRWLETAATPILDETGACREFFAASRDITARKEAETALRESEERFRSLIRTLQVGVVVQSPSAEILLTNPRALELLGLTEDQMLGRTSFDPRWGATHEDGSPFPGELHPAPQSIAQKRPIRGVVMGIHRPALGDRVWLLVDALPTLAEDGSVLKVTVTLTDISARIAAEALVREQAAMLHELSTPLIPISREVMVVPLVGAMIPQRLEQVTESLLPGVAAHGAKLVILDVTGVPHLDTQAVSGLVRAAQAVRLLGARMIITGIRPAIARTLVELGVDLSGIITLSTLQSGIAYALEGRSAP